ncbi:MAG: hypothetical protein K5857_10190 [Lachnospiraceae bacterium]|nr:hypothetical protein [Lachnospiraceae bacterium]
MEINKELEGMLYDNMALMKLFNKDTYKEAAEDYVDKYKVLFAEIDKAYAGEEDKEAYLKSLADDFALTARKKADEIKKRNDREHFIIDHNMVLTVYVFPALAAAGYESCRKLAQAIADSWNETFKGNKLSIGTFEEIDGGFKRKLCYITTAVCRSLGKDDDCYELRTLRNYRDGYLLSSDEGREVVDTYYNIAPTIVNRINKGDSVSGTYLNIFKEYISPCISLIESGDYEECKKLYSDMVYSLRDKYM